MPKLGTQIGNYTRTFDTFADRIAQASADGYSSIEILPWRRLAEPDPTSDDPAWALDALQQHGMSVVAAHVPTVDKLEESRSGIFSYLRALSINQLVITFVGPEVSYSTADAKQWADYGKRISFLADECHSEGITLGIHNHVLELLPVEGRIGLLRIFDQVPGNSLFWEADIGHVTASKVDFSYLLSEAGDRCRLVHIKDLDQRVTETAVLEGNGIFSSFEELGAPVRERIDWEVELGEGVIDLNRVIDLAKSHGVRWLISEVHKSGLELKQAHDFLAARLG